MVAGLVCTLVAVVLTVGFYVQIKIIYALAGSGAANNNNSGSSNSGGGGGGGGNWSWAKHCKQLDVEVLSLAI